LKSVTLVLSSSLPKAFQLLRGCGIDPPRVFQILLDAPRNGYNLPSTSVPGPQTEGGIVDNFPDSMKHPANKIATSSQATPGVEGYVFDGVDGSQIQD
jgi:hypothetical protein